MALSLSSIFFPMLILLVAPPPTSAATPACRTTCGSLPLKYPFGSDYGCGSPRFYPSVTCKSNQLLLTTHTGSYPVIAISPDTATVTVVPPTMSTCTAMLPDANFGVDWASPFQLGPSTIILVNCQPPTSSLKINDSPICDIDSDHLCAVLYTCPSVRQLGLPLFPPTNTCCVYSPANLNSKGDLDLKALKCGGFASVVGFGNNPTDPYQWQYGVTLKYTNGAFDEFYVANTCSACENSGGVCGYSPPGNAFVCVCNNGVNSTTDCSRYSQGQGVFIESESDSGSSFLGATWHGVLASFILTMAA